MNIMHLKYAAEIAKVGSLNKAAENLCMGQPNLSRSIKELEASLGITIFERSPKGMVPTMQGEEFLRYANKVLKQIDEIEKLYKGGEPKKQQFSISVPRASYIANAFAGFSTKIDPNLPAELFYKETNALRAVRNIVEADYHLGIIRYAAKHDFYFKEMLEEKGLNCELVTEFTYRLIMSEKHPLAEKDDISFDDLTPYTEIAHADPFVPSLPMSYVRKEELPDNIERRIFVFERASRFELLDKNHSTFMWVSPIPEETLKRYGLVERSCSANRKVYKDVLIYRKNYVLSELDRLFIAELSESKREYIR